MSEHNGIKGVSADGHGISRQFDEQLSEAAAVIGQYVQDGDESRPHYEHSVEALTAKLSAKRPNHPLDEIEWKVRELLKARATNESTMYPAVEKRTKSGSTFYPAQHVYLDFEGHAERLGRNWGLPVPSILFASLDPVKDGLYNAGQVDPETGARRGGCVAVAIYFDPAAAEEPRTITFKGESTVVGSDWDPACYQGIVRTFESFTAMRQARKDLERALKLVMAPVPTDAEDDPYADNEFLEEGLDDIDGF